MRNMGNASNTSAARVIASIYGILVGLAGIEHGFFEVLQGNIKPDGVLSAAIGPAQRFWEFGTEHAITLLPSFLIMGILSMIFGTLVVVWAARFVDRKHGAGILLLLGVLLFLVGGGFAPIFVTIAGFLTATRIDKPLTWWRAHVPGSLKAFLARLWPWSLVAFLLVFLVSVEIAIFGIPLVGLYGAERTMAVLSSLANWMLGLMILAPLTALARDVKGAGDKL